MNSVDSPCNKSCAPGYCYCQCPHGVTDGNCKECYDLKATVPSDCDNSHQPVAWVYTDPDKPRVKFLAWRQDDPGYRGRWIKTPIYTAPTQRKPLTDEEIEKATREVWRNLPSDFDHTTFSWLKAGIRYAERAHGIE